MKVIVIGGGVIGVCTAWYLARAGVAVTLLERQASVARETSFANAGQVSPGYSTPWAAPGMPLKALKWLTQPHAPFAIRPDGTLFQLRWMLALLANCNAASYARNKARMMRLAEHSRDCLRTLRALTGLHYEARTRGTLQVFRSEAQLESAARDLAVLDRLGVAHALLGRKALADVEPALARVAEKLTGGLHLPNDETGDCRLFTEGLADLCKTAGVVFRFGIDVDAIENRGQRVVAIRAGQERFEADAFVLAAGSYSRALARPLGLYLPVYPVKGYSLTIPLRDEALAPVSTVLDETNKIAITRFDSRIRVGGMAELAGFDLKLHPERRATLARVTEDLFPGAGDTAAAEFWTGLRPMTPDGTPIVGPTRLANLYLNTGHGTLGWTMACGSGEMLADLILGRQPAVPAGDFALARYEGC